MARTFRKRLRSLLSCGLSLSLGACTLVGGGVNPGPVAPPVATEPVGAAVPSARAEVATEREWATARVVEVALGAIGTPYRWGGTDANGFDCSGLIRFAYQAVGLILPRTSADQLRSGIPVEAEPARLLAGDILGFGGGPAGKVDHVGLHIGGDEFIHSSSSGVRISSLRDPYWRERVVAARRLVE